MTAAGLPFVLDIEQATSLHVEGNASIEFAGLLTVTGSFELDKVDVVEAMVGAGATALALSLTASVSGGGAGASGSLHLIQITNATNPAAVKSWLGVDASDLTFTLDFPPLSLAVTEGQLQLNSATGVGVTKLDWATITAAELPVVLDIAAADSLHVEGNASIEFAGLLTVTGSFELDQVDIVDTDLREDVGACATALALSLTASVSVGGAGASGSLHLIQFTNATNPAAVKSWSFPTRRSSALTLDFPPLSLAVTEGQLQLNSATG